MTIKAENLRITPAPNPFITVLAIVAGASILQVANALVALFIPIRMAAETLPASAIGTVVTSYSLGFLLGCLAAPRVIGAVGHIRAFAALAALASASTLAFAIDVDTWIWALVRFVHGLAYAGLLTVAESWLNERAPTEKRGQILSFYFVAVKMATIVGQLMLTMGDVMSPLFIMLASAIFSLALIPVTTTRAVSPKVPEFTKLNIRKLYSIAPAALVGCFFVGLANPAVTNLAPAFAAKVGIPQSQIAYLMAAVVAGSIVLQWPIGKLSDRIDRRSVIIGISLGTAAISLALGMLGEYPLWLLYAAFALWGGLGLAIYAVCVAHANDMADPSEMVGVAGSLLLAWSAGATIGPLLATLAMDAFGPRALFLYNAAALAIMSVFIGWRITRRRPVPPEDREKFIPLSQTSPAYAELDPRTDAKSS